VIIISNASVSGTVLFVKQFIMKFFYNSTLTLLLLNCNILILQLCMFPFPLRVKD